MKKLLIYLSCFLLFFGCVKKIQETKNKNQINPIEVLSFKNADIDKSGNISKQEFENIQKQRDINYTDPFLSFVGIVGTVAILLIVSNFIQSKKSKDV